MIPASIFRILLFLAGFTHQFPELPAHDPNKITIPVGGNAWVQNGGEITDQGLSNWSDPQTVCTVYLRVAQAGKLKLSLLLNTQNGKSSFKVTIRNRPITLNVSSNSEKEFFVGEWLLDKPGYVPIQIQGLTKTGASFGKLASIAVSGSAINTEVTFVKDNKEGYFYWGRRGPSVHLRYHSEGLNDVQWFYSEITVPKRNDVIGSYFMANGFGEGYFGIQVNSETERRVLFSVWSPYETDNPNAIPEDYKITLQKKGDQVKTGEFGNEGSGGQSFLVFPWKAENTYKFLLQGKPLPGDFTVYTAYFFAPETKQWKLIASFKRPHTTTYLKDLYSFLENFEPETGTTSRMALYGNQWVADKNGKWSELNDVDFTADNTARKNFRKDYSGGLSNGKFFLKNCGFFSDFVPFDQSFTRPLTKVQPVIDFSKLPQ
jgi:hypothetical protein